MKYLIRSCIAFLCGSSVLLGEGQMIVDPPEVMRIEFDELKGLVHQLSAEFFKLKETLDQKKVNK